VPRKSERALPKKQYAVQLTGPSALVLNKEKPVVAPGPTQMLCRVEAVGLCFSDLKLLKQFSEHARKSEVIAGLSKEALAEIPSYVPGTKPTVPGHEAVCRIVATGAKVKRHKVGQRVLVQADYRFLKTAGSNGAFGYNFEGALQEYVLMDERVMIDPETGDSFLIPVPEDLSASALCLVEPWACVEDSYVSSERQAPLAGGRMLVVVESYATAEGLDQAVALSGAPGTVTAICAGEALQAAMRAVFPNVRFAEGVDSLANEGFDDIIYFGASKATVEALNDKLAQRGLVNIVLGARRFGEPVSIGVGRVHYGFTRWVGTAGSSAVESYRIIPATGEIRPGDSITVVGAAGPMGQMHVIRSLSAGVPGVTVTGMDIDDARLATLAAKAEPLARARGVGLKLVNSTRETPAAGATYIALMAPVGALLADAVKAAGEGSIINVFAGIPAPVKHAIDLDAYIAKHCYMFGTSGSVVRDMKIVLDKVVSHSLDTNASVDAVSGMAGALDGLAAVENRTLSGKIIVYPSLHNLGLVPLSRLAETLPKVAAKLSDGVWSKPAEDELLIAGA